MKITVNGYVIEGTQDELKYLIEMIMEQKGSLEEKAELPHGDLTVQTSINQHTPLTAEEFRQVWSEITPGSQHILKIIANHPQGYPMSELLKLLNVDGYKLGGTLSSLGFAVRRRPGKQDPLERDWVNSQYRLQPDIAIAIRELPQKPN